MTRTKEFNLTFLSSQIWFTELPLEALWLANIYDWFGGSAVWYLGVYTFAADITSVEQRASRMARYGGRGFRYIFPTKPSKI